MDGWMDQQGQTSYRDLRVETRVAVCSTALDSHVHHLNNHACSKKLHLAAVNASVFQLLNRLAGGYLASTPPRPLPPAWLCPSGGACPWW
ncbi:unnamed protein product [Periconia digitata]|uniref:Uncharacterized protein n=1 Tax=Periconia digitata TaxID=1303443 RepID=A0A9W4UW37_9PLEO|nr:unnamed protein product [Periconia digitata]